MFFCTIYEKILLNITKGLTKFIKWNRIIQECWDRHERVNDMVKAECDICMNYAYDEEYECMMCTVDMDEDELYSLSARKFRSCPYFRPGDDYTVVKRQI